MVSQHGEKNKIDLFLQGRTGIPVDEVFVVEYGVKQRTRPEGKTGVI